MFLRRYFLFLCLFIVILERGGVVEVWEEGEEFLRFWEDGFLCVYFVFLVFFFGINKIYVLGI